MEPLNYQIRFEFAFVVLLLIFTFGCSQSTSDLPLAHAQSAAVNAEANLHGEPELVDLNDHEFGRVSDTTIKAAALVFILPDCPICNSYIPELNRLHEEFSTMSIKMILVHADPATTPEQARQHARDYQIQLPVALDPLSGWVKKAGATVAPEVALFSPHGELLYRGRIDNQYAELGKRRATITEHDLRDAMEEVVANQPISVRRTEAIGCLIPRN